MSLLVTIYRYNYTSCQNVLGEKKLIKINIQDKQQVLTKYLSLKKALMFNQKRKFLSL